MTDQGYKATHPSGTEPPQSKQSVKSSMVGLKPFEYQSSKTEAEFFNEFKLSTEFNGVSNTETVIVKTSLIYVKEQGRRRLRCITKRKIVELDMKTKFLLIPLLVSPKGYPVFLSIGLVKFFQEISYLNLKSHQNFLLMFSLVLNQ